MSEIQTALRRENAFKPNSNTLTKDVHTILRDKIVNFEFAFGKRINSNALAFELGVSQTPIRSALGALIRDGLVIEQPRRGYYIVELTVKLMQEIYDLRKMIECHALKYGMDRIDRTELEQLLVRKKSRQSSKNGKNRVKEDEPAHRKLHLVIVNSCPNERIRQMYSDLYPLVMISQRLNPLYERSDSEHIDLIKAILAGNRRRALDILEQHLDNCAADGAATIEKRLWLQKT